MVVTGEGWGKRQSALQDAPFALGLLLSPTFRASGSAWQIWTLSLVAGCPGARGGRGGGEQNWSQDLLLLNTELACWETAGGRKMGRRGLCQAANSLLSRSLSSLFLQCFHLWAVTSHISYWVISSLVFPSCPTSLGMICALIRMNCLWPWFLCPCGNCFPQHQNCRCRDLEGGELENVIPHERLFETVSIR